MQQCVNARLQMSSSDVIRTHLKLSGMTSSSISAEEEEAIAASAAAATAATITTTIK